MEAPDRFDEMAQACITNHDQIMRHGSSEMQTASQILLYALAQEIALRERRVPAANDDET